MCPSRAYRHTGNGCRRGDDDRGWCSARWWRCRSAPRLAGGSDRSRCAAKVSASARTSSPPAVPRENTAEASVSSWAASASRASRVAWCLRPIGLHESDHATSATMAVPARTARRMRERRGGRRRGLRRLAGVLGRGVLRRGVVAWRCSSSSGPSLVFGQAACCQVVAGGLLGEAVVVSGSGRPVFRRRSAGCR